MSFEWLSLDEFVEEVRKSLQDKDISKGDSTVHSYNKDVGGQQFRVRQHVRHTLSNPVADVGHVKHFVNNAPKEHSGGLSSPDAPDTVPTVPVTKEKKVVEPIPDHPHCSNCDPTKAAPVADGAEDVFKYPSPALPIKGKVPGEITLNDIAGSLNKHRFLNKQQWEQLSPEDQESHVKNHNMVHLNDDAKAALHNHVRRIVKGYMEKKLEQFQLHRVGVDPEQAVDFFTDRIINEMKPHYRAGQEHNYAVGGSAEYKDALKNGDIPVKRLYHQGIDPNKINNGKDLVTFIRSKANDKWPLRIINKELPTGYTKVDKDGKEAPQYGYSGILNSQAVINHNNKLKEARDAENQMRRVEQKHGVGEMSVDPTQSYDLKSLEGIASKNGYVLEQHASSDGSKMERVVISDYSTGNPHPIAEVDFTKGQSLAALRDKLASIVNPKQQEAGPTPLKKYMGLSKDKDELESKMHFSKQDYHEAKERFDRASVSPEDHLKSIEKYAADAINVAEGINSELHDKPEAQLAKQTLTRITEATEQVTQTGDHKRAEQELKNAMQGAKELATKYPQSANATALAMAVDKLRQDVQAYSEKAQIPEAEREKQLDKLFDQYKDKEESFNNHEAKMADLKSQLGETSTAPEVAEYRELEESAKKAHAAADAIRPQADSAWQQFSFQEQGEGENTKGEKNNSDQLEAAAGSAKAKAAAGSDAEWYEKIPDDINFEDEDQASSAAKQLLDAYKHVHHPGEFIFGNNPNVAKGIMHVADHYMNTKVKNETVDFIKDMHDKYPPNKGVPPPFLQGPGMTTARRFAKKIFDLSPKIVAHYALKFSDYAPVPYNTKDVFENEVQDEHGKPYFNLLLSDIATKVPQQKNLAPVNDSEGKQVGWKLKPSHEWDGMPTKKTFDYQYYKLLRELGNAAVQQAMKKHPDVAPVMDLVRELNHAPKKQQHLSAETPGNLRRDLQRKMDVLYGQTFGKFPDWHHKKSPNEEQGWLNSLRNITPENNEKSLVIYEDVLRKAVKLIIEL